MIVADDTNCDHFDVAVSRDRWILTVFTQPLCFDAAARQPGKSLCLGQHGMVQPAGVWDLIVCDGLQAEGSAFGKRSSLAKRSAPSMRPSY